MTILLTFEGVSNDSGPCFGLWSYRFVWGLW